MMACIASSLAVSMLLAQSVTAFNCSIPPIYVDIHKRAVHESDVFEYGSFIGVGTPAQNHSLWPSFSKNETSFASHAYCYQNNDTLPNCDTSTGGFFNSNDSTTFIAEPNYQSFDSSGNDSVSGYFGRDAVHLYTHYFETDPASQTLVPNTSIKVAEAGSIVPGIVGLGQESTLLKDMANRNIICGRTYSVYMGVGFDRAGGVVNGSSVFGGYDSGRFTGDVHTYSMDLNSVSPLRVTVQDIIITETGKPSNNVSLFDLQAFPNMTARPASFDAQITTEQYPLSLPYQLTQNFISHLSASPNNYWGDNSLKLNNAFNGTLTIVLSDGFAVTLPPSILMNASNITPIQDRDEQSTDPFLLSTAFLTQVYLMLDYEAQQFYLAEAVQLNAPVIPVTFCPKTTPVAYILPHPSLFLKQGLIGAVIGGLIGGSALIIFGYCLYVSCMRRKDERRLTRELKQLEKGRRDTKIAAMEVEDVTTEFDPPPKTSTPFFWKKR